MTTMRAIALGAVLLLLVCVNARSEDGSHTGLMSHVVEAGRNIVVVEGLDAGRVQEAKSFLNLQINTSVIAIDAWLKDEKDEKKRETALGMLIRIAKQRKSHPAQWTKEHRKLMTNEMIEKVDSILERALLKKNK